ncbi:hypothetical protein FRC17_004143 [Serendipita sp. 399]|nr:hypothetical protein FRC17_004143 [Serendipita sp. 399]
MSRSTSTTNSGDLGSGTRDRRSTSTQRTTQQTATFWIEDVLDDADAVVSTPTSTATDCVDESNVLRLLTYDEDGDSIAGLESLMVRNPSRTSACLTNKKIPKAATTLGVDNSVIVAHHLRNLPSQQRESPQQSKFDSMYRALTNVGIYQDFACISLEDLVYLLFGKNESETLSCLVHPEVLLSAVEEILEIAQWLKRLRAYQAEASRRYQYDAFMSYY